MKYPIPVKEQNIILGPLQAVIVPTDSDKLYAAGFFDGEGSVTIGINYRGGHERTTLTYNMRVGVAQKNPTPLLWLRERWGGSLTLTKPHTRTRRQYYQWGCFSKGAANFLTDVMPHLKVKAAQADLALRFRASIRQPGRRGRSTEEAQRLSDFKQQLTALNARGT